jgi:hypothetical protein
VVRSDGDEPEITISTGALDREGDVLVPEGAVFDAYRRNPVVLFGHNHSELPVGSTTSIAIEPGIGIRAAWRWLEGDDRAARVRNAFDQGVLRAASVGFIPLEDESLGRRGLRYTKWEVIEWSLVPVGANAEAVRTLKALGLSQRIDLSPVSRAVKVLRASGDGTSRTLSANDARAIRQAIEQLQQFLGDRSESNEVLIDGVPISDEIDLAALDIDEADLTQLIAEIVGEQVMRVTGRLPDGPPRTSRMRRRT